jgi:Raf kinase inhibitor-like YbhB/YbcL family protein
MTSGRLYGLTVTSTGFGYGDNIPAAQEGNLHGHSGPNLSPQLTVSDIPAGTRSYALIMDDPDAPAYVHWLMYWNNTNITSMNENSIPAGAVQGMNTAWQTGYLGPCPPSDHRYRISIYALSFGTSLPSGFTVDRLNAVLAAYALDRNTLLGYFPGGGVASCTYTLSETSVNYNASSHSGSVPLTAARATADGWQRAMRRGFRSWLVTGRPASPTHIFPINGSSWRIKDKLKRGAE